MQVIYYGDKRPSEKIPSNNLRFSDKTIWFLELNQIKYVDLDEFKIKPLPNSEIISYKKGKYSYDSSIIIPECKPCIPIQNTGNNIITYIRVLYKNIIINNAHYLKCDLERLFIIQFNISFFVSKCLLLETFLYKDITNKILSFLIQAVVYYYDMKKADINGQTINSLYLDEYYNIPKTHFMKLFFKLKM